MSIKQISAILVRLEAQNSRYEKKLEQSRKSTKKFRKHVQSEMGKVSGAFKGFLAVFTLRAVGGFYSEHLEGIDKLAKSSDKLGITSNALQGIRHAGELAGVGIKTTDTALFTMLKGMSEAKEGSGELVSELEVLGLSAEALSKMSTDEKLFAVARAMEGIEDPADRARISMSLFGKKGADLVNALSSGEDSLRSAAGEVDAYGLSISRIDAAKIEIANDNFMRAGKVVKSFGQRIAVETAPLMSGLAGLFLGAAKESAGMGNIAQKATNVVIVGVGFAADVVHGLKVAWLGVRLAVAEVIAVQVKAIDGVLGAGQSVLSRLGIDSSGIATMREFADSFRGTVDTFHEEFQQALLGRMPGEEVKAWAEDIFAKSQSEAERLAAEKGNLSKYLIGDPTADDDAGVQIKKKQEFYKETEALQRSHFGKTFKTQQHFTKLRENFEKSSALGRIAIASGETFSLLQTVSSGSKKLFKLSKLAGISNALISTYQGIAAGVKLGWPMAIPAVAWAALNGFAQVKKLQSMQFGGGGSGGGSAGITAPDVSVPSLSEQVPESNLQESQDTGPQGVTQVIFQGDIFGHEDFEDKILSVLGDASDNRRIRFSDESGRTILETI